MYSTFTKMLLLLLSFALVSCRPSREQKIQIAIAQTIAAAPTYTPPPTYTPVPTPTSVPPTPTQTALHVAYLTLEELIGIQEAAGKYWEAPVERDCVYKIKSEENECLTAVYTSYAEGVDSPLFTQFTRFKNHDLAMLASQALMKNFSSGGIILQPTVELERPENPWFVQYRSVVIMGWVQEQVMVTITHPIVEGLTAEETTGYLSRIGQVQHDKLLVLGFQ